jgi:hypothetical protein
MKSKVYFSADIEKILGLIKVSSDSNIGIKLHFGEKGCKTYINPEIVKQVYDFLSKTNKNIRLIETNTLYRGQRNKTGPHLKIAKEHGYDFSEINIIDSEGEKEVKTKLKHFSNIKYGKNLDAYNELVVISHVKGHCDMGFGGAIKNVGMGLASRGGKLAIHTNTNLLVNDKCKACGVCAENCSENAIKIEKKAVIDYKKCIGCGYCISICPEGAIKIPWSSSSKEVQEKLVEYCYAIIKNRKAIYINVLKNITKECDCVNFEQKKEIEDIGFLFSDDIVAIDKASYNLINKKAGTDLFRKFHNNVDSKHQFEYGEQIGLGSQEYNLINL